MAVPVTAIHVFVEFERREFVDARNKSGHDSVGCISAPP
jgi:hypothetical protein